MKISLSWLSDFIEFTEKDPEKIAARITEAVAEVEEVIHQGELLEHCCVGKVLTVEKHPNADKLSLCDVETDKRKKRVVCGGTNLRVGMRVAFAHIGARVRWHGEEMMTLEPVKIRGEKSEGMICAAEELDLAAQFPECTGHSIVDLGDSDEDIGTPLKKYFGFDDTILNIDNHAITHRADLFSHIGFARECVAIGIAKWKKKPEYKLPSFPKEKLPFKVHNDCKDLVPRYVSCLLSIDGIGETPEWMVKRLEATGWRSVSLPVDITNYVTMEVGMPLHSFDAGDFKGDIHIRTTKKGETIKTLDDVDRELPEGAIVISDDEGIFDLLGIMGGLRSSTKEGTKSVYLHSAVVDPVSIRKAIVATGHRTEAATVYEKGVPHITAYNGFARALELFLELVPGCKIVSAKDEWGDDGKQQEINLSCDRVRSLLGVDISSKEMSAILEKLEFSVSGKGDDLKVTVPLHRLGDITGPHDLIEEVGRVYGYNTIESVLPMGGTEPPARDFRLQKMRHALKEQGFWEFLPLSLLGPDLLTKCNMDPKNAAEVENAIGEELSLMQPCMCPRLLDHASANLSHSEGTLKTFHVGTIFGKSSDMCTALGAMIAQKASSDLLSDPFLQLKSDFAAALKAAGYTYEVRRSKKPHVSAHPGRAADVMIDGKELGWIFEVHPTVRAKFGLPERAAIVLLNVTTLLEIEPTVVIAESLPKFPSVSYDVTVTMDHGKEVGSMIEVLQKKSELLESVEIADLYSGDTADGKYNLTLRLTYRSSERTLTDEEAQKEHRELLKTLQ